MSSNNKPKFELVRDDSSMDEIKRRFHSNPFVFVGTVIVLIIVIVAFVLVPAIVPEAGGPASSALTFGYYNNIPLTYNGGNYFAQVRAQYESEAQRYGYDTYTVWQNAYHAFAVRTAVLDTMKRAGYEPPAEMVNKKTAELPVFLDENGRFSRTLFSQYDASARLALINEVKNDLIVERYRDDIMGILPSSRELAFIGSMAAYQRSFKIAAAPYSVFPDSEVIAFAEKHPDLFVSLRLSQITVPKESDAKKILASIQGEGITFEDAARNQSKDEFAGRGGDAGSRLAYEVHNLAQAEADRAALGSLAKGGVSGVVKTSDGWSIFRAEEDAAPADFSDSATLARVRSYIETYERGSIEDYLLARAGEIAAASGHSGGADEFERAAQDAEFTVSDFGPLPVNYGDVSFFSTLSSFGGIAAFQRSPLAPDSGAAFDENFWKIAFESPLAAASRPFILNGRQSYVALLYPKEELTDAAAEENSRSMFTARAEGIISQDVENAILASSRFEDNFDTTFQALFPDQFYQHSFSGFNF